MFPRFFAAMELLARSPKTSDKEATRSLRSLQYWRNDGIPSVGMLLAANPELLEAFVADVAAGDLTKVSSSDPLTSEENFAIINE